jgi:hypothetical protein
LFIYAYVQKKEVLSPRNLKEKEDRIGESQPFEELILLVLDKVPLGENPTLVLSRKARYPPS